MHYHRVTQLRNMLSYSDPQCSMLPTAIYAAILQPILSHLNGQQVIVQSGWVWLLAAILKTFWQSLQLKKERTISHKEHSPLQS
jgi:hypothetical protein